MTVVIFAEDKPAEKVFVDKLEVADKVLLLSTTMLLGAIALASLYSVLSGMISVFFGSGLCYNF